MKRIFLKKIKKMTMKTKNGFSLLEVLMALFVLSVGVMGILTMISNSVVNSNEARDAIIAAQLGQEGIELFRHIRDTNIEQDPSDVFDGISAGVCAIDISAVPDCSFGANYALSYVDNFGKRFIKHDSDPSTPRTRFSRKVVVEETVPEERKLRSFVYWGAVAPIANDGSDCLNINKCLFVEAVLTDWGQN